MITIRGGFFQRTVMVATAIIAWTTATGHADGPSAGSDELFQRLDVDANGALSATEVPPQHKRLFERLLRKADVNRDDSLTRDEFLAGLVPSRPDKPIEDKQPGDYPQANAVRYLLLTLDTRKDSRIEEDEIPERMRPLFESMVERLDMNKNGSIDRYELSRGARELAQIAARYVARERIDVAQELSRFDKSQGELAQRFDKAPGPLFESFGNAGSARRIFKELDADSDNKLTLDELPPPVQQQFERFMQRADRDRDGGLSEREFLAAAERISRVQARQRSSATEAKPKPDAKARRRPTQKPRDLAPAQESPDQAMPAEEKP